MSVSDLVPYGFDFELPKELIAQEPLENRTDARLMVVNRADDSIEHSHIRDLPQILSSKYRLVLNNTKVIPAKLQGYRTSTKGKWQGLYLGATEEQFWKIICKTRGSLRVGESITLQDRDGRDHLTLHMVKQLEAGKWLVSPESKLSPYELLANVGRVPLPHYIRQGQMVDSDERNYQTVFAKKPGAVAAPTAGLHFTDALLQSLTKRGSTFSAVTLHVGMGTFRPISTKSLEDHKMHSEYVELTELAAQEINNASPEKQKILAVGTTSVRVLEQAASLTVNPGERVTPYAGETDIFIRPPYQFKAVDALLTNFHFPRTTLLVLVQTFASQELIQRAYHEAIAERYRFFSYGDAMLIL